MGCTPSATAPPSPADSQRHPKRQRETVAQAFRRIEVEAAEAESGAPGAHLAALLPLLAYLQQELNRSDELPPNLVYAGDAQEDALLEVIVNLKISLEPRLATEHEEFVANINRQIMDAHNRALTEKELEQANARRTQLEMEIIALQHLYREQDLLLERVLGAEYGSAEERQLEARLGSARALRDTLAAAAASWAGAARRAHLAHHCAAQALLAWQLLPHASSVAEQVRLGMESLRTALAGEVALHWAHALLPAAPFPHCTPRQLQALHLTLEYMFTDMFSPDRYNHGTRVFTGFSERSLSLAGWLTETLKTTLQKDLEEIESSISTTAEQLQSLRVNLIAERGLAGLRYVPPPPPPLPPQTEQSHGQLTNPS